MRTQNSEANLSSTARRLFHTCAFVGALLTSIGAARAQPKVSIELNREPQLCGAYQEALSDLTRSVKVVSRTLLCERPISSVNKEFAVPAWNSSESILRRKGVLRRIDDFRWRRDADPTLFVTANTRSSWKGSPEQLKEAKEGFMNSRESRAVIGHLTASVDIDNDGKPEQVYFDQACHSLFGSVLIVLTDGLDDLDFKKTDSLLIHPDWKTLKKNITARQPKDVHTDPSRASALVNSLYGVFIYHGKSYFDYAWYPSDLIAGAADPKDVTTKIQVFIDESGKTSEVCRLQLNMFAQ